MEQQVKTAAELRMLPANSELAQFVTDYGALRARLRAVCPQPK